MNIATFFKQKSDLTALLALPSIRELLNTDDKHFNERRALIVERDALRNGKHDKAKAAANGRLAAAKNARDLAEAAFVLSKIAEAEAFGAASNASYIETRELVGLEKRLTETSDPRLSRFWTCTDVLHDDVRFGFQQQFDHKDAVGDGTYTRHFTDNNAAMHSTMAMLIAARDDAEAMRFQALTRAEVTTRLRGWCDKLTAPLAEFNRKPPIVKADEVEPAQSFWPDPPMTAFVGGKSFA